MRHERQNSLFNNRGRFAANPSPGRGEIRKNPHYSGAVARRVFKRRQRDKELGRRVRMESDDESDRDRPSSSEGASGKSAKRGKSGSGDQSTGRSSLAQLFEFLEAHPNIPSILSWWAQLTVNVSIFSMAVYVVWSVLRSIRAEFNHRAELESEHIFNAIHKCANDFVVNGCENPSRPPALQNVCDGWQACMDRDPHKIGHAQLSAGTMAVIINSFIEPISWKAVVRCSVSAQCSPLCRSSANSCFRLSSSRP